MRPPAGAKSKPKGLFPRSLPSDLEVGPLLRPGGIMAEDTPAVVPRRRGPNRGTNYQDAFKGESSSPQQQPDVVQGPKGRRATEATHDRCIAHEQPQTWRQQLQSTYRVNGLSDEEIARAARKDVKRHGTLSMEEQEQRWRRWLRKKQAKTSQGVGQEQSQVSGMASTVPAGLRPAKCANVHAPGGILLPLYGQDVPKPSYTLFSAAPWVGREPPHRPAEVPNAAWLMKYDDPTHPFQGRRRYPDADSPAMPSSARSVVSEVRQSLDQDVAGAAKLLAGASKGARAVGASRQEPAPKLPAAKLLPPSLGRLLEVEAGVPWAEWPHPGAPPGAPHTARSRLGKGSFVDVALPPVTPRLSARG